MKIKEEIEVGVTAKAVLRDGSLAVSVGISVPYFKDEDGRVRESTSYRLNFDEKLEKSIKADLEKAIEEAMDNGLLYKAKREAMRAHEIADVNGELG